MHHEYTDKMVTPWGGMKEMKELIDKSRIREKMAELGLPESKSNNSIPALDIIESFWGKYMDWMLPVQSYCCCSGR